MSSPKKTDAVDPNSINSLSFGDFGIEICLPNLSEVASERHNNAQKGSLRADVVAFASRESRQEILVV
jgi:hypothetical protein